MNPWIISIWSILLAPKFTMDFNELKHQEAFNNWFPNDFASKSSYITGLKSIQKKLNCDIDSLLADGLKPALNKLTPELFDNNKKLSGNAVSHLKKYHAFYQEKFNKLPFKKETDFKKWLPSNGVEKTAGDYVSYIKSIQNNLNIDIDELLKTGLEKALEKINSKNINKSESSISSYKTGLNKYYEFIKSTNQS